MAALEPFSDPDELFIDRHRDLEWADDVHAYLCTRCDKVLVQHYIANCEHKFCGNCKRVVDDGSQRWRCPNCKEFIKDIVKQSVQFKEKIMSLRVHCPNRKYGCQHICPFKDIKEHLAGCEHTKERALPVLYHEGPTVEMLDRMFSAQLLNLRNEMNRKLAEMEKRDWELSVAADEMRRVMVGVERRQREGEERVVELVERMDGVRADLQEEIYDLQKQPMRGNLEGVSLAVEENKSRIVKLETKSESYLEIIDFNNRKSFEQMHQLKSEVEGELKTADIRTQNQLSELEQTMNEMALEQKKKWAETKEEVSETIKEEREKREEVTSNVNKNSTHLLALSEQIESLGKDLRRDLQNQMSEVNHRNQVMYRVSEKRSEVNRSIETMDSTLNVMQKSMREMREKELDGERMWVENDRKWVKHEENYNERTRLLDNKMSQLSSAILALKEKLKETEEKFPDIEVQGVYNSVIKAEFQHLRRVNEYYKEKADFTWIVSHVNSLPYGSEKEVESEVFPLTGYPFAAQAKIKLNGYDVWFYLCFKPPNESNVKEDRGVKPYPRFYFTVKDQSERKERKDCIRTTFFYYEHKFEFNRYYLIRHSVAKSLINGPLYTVDDKWVIDIHMEAPEVAQSVYSHDGTLNWAIDDFRKRKQMEVNGLIKYQVSPYFYTSPKGVRVQVQAHLNGYDDYKNKGVSIYVAFLNGVYDEDLGNSFFSHNITLTIFHPNQPHRTISRSKKSFSLFYGALFEMESEAEIESLLHHDTLYYKVTVEINKIK